MLEITKKMGSQTRVHIASSIQKPKHELVSGSPLLLAMCIQVAKITKELETSKHICPFGFQHIYILGFLHERE